MRDLLLATIVFGSLPFILARPYIGILVFAWLGYMNPHRLSWGFAYEFPFAFIVAVVTLVAVMASNEPKRVPVTGLTLLWVAFIGWMGITTLFALYPAEAWVQCQKVMKIQLMSFATIVVMTTKERLRMLIWVIVLSLGFFGFKGGVFTILTGGDFRVWGPPGTFVEGNNEIALALLMTLPLMYYLRMTSDNRWVRLGLLAGMVLCAFSIVGSQSRGAFIGGFAMAFFLWLKSKRKIAVGAVTVALIAALFAFMPQTWYDRMRTIETYELDASAMGRIQVWRTALAVANDRPLGAGFELWTEEIFSRYSVDKAVPHDAHSIYFKVLGEHGWIGLALFLAIGIAAWRTGSWIVHRTNGRDDLHWLSDLARMVQVSVAAFAAGGAFLGLSYFDLYWHLLSILVIGKALLRRELAAAPSQARAAGPPASALDGGVGLPAGRNGRAPT
jgi:probable O-glycosylation ligase (exosortase A-associated)